MFTEVIRELQKKADEEYEAKVRALLGHYGVESPDQLDEAQKAQFFEQLDASHISDEEELGIDSESLEEGKVSFFPRHLLLSEGVSPEGLAAGGLGLIGGVAAHRVSPRSEYAPARGVAGGIAGGGLGGYGGFRAGLGMVNNPLAHDILGPGGQALVGLGLAGAGALGGAALGGHLAEKGYQAVKQSSFLGGIMPPGGGALGLPEAYAAPLLGAMVGSAGGAHGAQAANANPSGTPESVQAAHRGGLSPLSIGGGVAGGAAGMAAGEALARMAGPGNLLQIPAKFVPAALGALGGGALGGYATEKGYQAVKEGSESLEESKVGGLQSNLQGLAMVGAMSAPVTVPGWMAGELGGRMASPNPTFSSESDFSGIRGVANPLAPLGSVGGMMAGFEGADALIRRFPNLATGRAGRALMALPVAGAMAGGALGGYAAEKGYQASKPLISGAARHIHEATKQSSVWQEATDIIEKIANQAPAPPVIAAPTPSSQTAGQQQSQIAGKFSHPSWKLRAKKVQGVYDPSQTVSDQMMENRTLK